MRFLRTLAYIWLMILLQKDDTGIRVFAWLTLAVGAFWGSVLTMLLHGYLE